ncbi:C2 domain-containing protein 5-like [Styela clava]
MPGRLKVKILSGRHLPVMDRASELTDAFVEVKFGNTTYKTDVYLKSLNPSWNSEWFIFEVDDEHLQDEPLQIRVLDHDTYSSHDAIGKIYIDIDPLLVPDSPNSLHGWFPIYDTMHGIRGEILISVKIELFADFNRFKKSSCGIKFICGTVIPECYRISIIQGFVEELVVSEDPEYQWIDKLRTPRATNEARQRLFSQVSGELQRRIGTKVIDMGGNTVVGYHQHFDIEGEFGVVVRGFGTAVTLETQSRLNPPPLPTTPTSLLSFSPSTTSPLSDSPVKFSFPPRSSSLDSDTGAKISPNASHPGQSWNTTNSAREALENLEAPFFTLTTYPPNFLIHLGGVVSAHSVKLLDKIHNPDAPETRDAWWHEIRQEIISHSSALSCNAVVGYREYTSICDELIVLSAQGTAAVINPNLLATTQHVNETSMIKEKLAASGPYSAAIVLDTSHPLERINTRKRHNSGSGVPSSGFPQSFTSPLNPTQSNAGLFQVPYQNDAPFPIAINHSPLDTSIQVPEVLFTTIDIPTDVHITGKGTIVQARFCRSKKKSQGESHAAAIGDILPFIEYELHKQLYNKLKLKGMNALFGLQVRIKIGENIVIGVATATAAYVTALPPTEKPKLNCQNVKHGSAALENVEQLFHAEVEKNKEFFDLTSTDSIMSGRMENLDLLNSSAESKQSLPVSVEDPDDAEQLRSMIDPLPPLHCYMSNCQHVPGLPHVTNNLQTFSMLWRIKYREGAGDRALNRGLNFTCRRAFNSIWYRLSRLSPTFCLCGVRFNLLVPEDDEIHVWVSASAVSYKPPKTTDPEISYNKSTIIETVDGTNDLQFYMETDEKDKNIVGQQNDENATERHKNVDTNLHHVHRDPSQTNSGSIDIKSSGQNSLTSSSGSSSPLRLDIFKAANHGKDGSSLDKSNVSRSSMKSRHSSDGSSVGGSASRHIEIVPMCYVPGRRIQRHIGFVNMFLIRETSAVRGGEERLPGTELQRGTGSNWFAHTVFAEVQAMLRAHVSALGGNALTSYRIEQCTLSESVAKNQAQCLIHVCGDAVVCTPANLNKS